MAVSLSGRPVQAETDEMLMSAIAGKDRNALRELMRRHEARVRRFAFRYTGSDDASRELAQDIFFKIYTSAGSYSPRARFTTWLYRITANHCLNYVRSIKNSPVQQLGDPVDDFKAAAAGRTQLEELETSEQAEQVRRAVESLPERQRLAILLLRFEELSYRDAARAIGCSVSALEALVHRGCETLKQKLGAFYKGE